MEADQEGPVDVTFGGETAAAARIEIASPTDVKDNDGPFVKTVTFKGAGEAVDLNNGFNVGYRRKFIADNVHLTGEKGGAGYFFNYGKTVFRNGATWSYEYGNNYGGTHAPGASLTVDDATVRFFAYSFTPGSKVTVKNGGKLGWDRSFVTEAYAKNYWGVDWNVIDGDISHAWLGCYTAGFFPKRSGTLNTSGKFVKPYNPRDAKWRLGGTAEITGAGGNSLLYTTNNATIYGRGVLHTYGFGGAAGTTNVYDLSEISHFRGSDNNAVSYFLGDTHFRCTPEGSSLAPKMGLGADSHWRGENVFHCSANGTAAHWSVSTPKSVSRDTAFRFVEGVAGDTAKQDVSLSLPVFRFGALELGDNVLAQLRPRYYHAVHTHDFTMGKNSSLDTLYDFNFVRALGEVSVDPTAKIIVPCGASRAAGAAPAPFFCALDEIPDGVVQPKTVTEGNFVSRVGGCCFYWDGTYAPTAADYTWNGSADGNWSTSENWTKSGPNESFGATFHTYAHLVSTNDIVGLVTPGVRFDNTSGPCILRGNPVELTATVVDSWDSAVANNSSYPQIIELDVSSQAAVLGVSSRHQNCAIAPICFRGNVDVPNGAFAPTGITVIDGTLNAKELQLLNMTQANATSGVTAENSPTLLAVRKTGAVNIANQVSEHSTTSMLWIAKGGRVNVTGDWVSTGYENEHVVKGAFAVSGKLGGSKTQTYIGEGVLKAGTTDGAGGAKLRIGEDLTVAPTTADFGTMPIEVAYGNVTFAPTCAGVMGQAVDIAALGAVVTVTNDAAYVLSGDWAGFDFDLVKTGSGRLTLDNAVDSSGRGYVTVETGTLAWTKPQTFGKLITKPGSALAFGSADGAVAPLTLNDGVDLTGVTVMPADAAAKAATLGKFSTILTVPEDCEIKGTPVAADGTVFRTVANADGTTSLQGKVPSGLMLILR